MLAMSSDPNSTLNQARMRLYEAKKAFGGHMSPNDHSKSTRDMNRARTALKEVAYYMRDRHYQPKRRETPHLNTEVDGIPCGIVVDYYKPAEPWRQRNFRGAGPGDCDPPEPEECEWHLIDRKGYAAPWLEAKLTGDDIDRINEMVRDGYRR